MISGETVPGEQLVTQKQRAKLSTALTSQRRSARHTRLHSTLEGAREPSMDLTTPSREPGHLPATLAYQQRVLSDNRRLSTPAAAPLKAPASTYKVGSSGNDEPTLTESQKTNKKRKMPLEMQEWLDYQTGTDYTKVTSAVH